MNPDLIHYFLQNQNSEPKHIEGLQMIFLFSDQGDRASVWLDLDSCVFSLVDNFFHQH